MNRPSKSCMLVDLILVALLAATGLVLVPAGVGDVDAWGVKPSDDVDGAYVQYLEGSWYVTSDQTITGEKVDLTGDLVVYKGATLTLKGTTLRFNCSTSGEFGITVETGGRLEVLDKDGVAATWGDESVMTDGVMDTDDFSASDLGYTFTCNYGSSLKIHNSKVDNAGTMGGKFSSGLILYNSDIDIQNTTFSHLMGGIRASSFSTLRLANVTMQNVWGDSLSLSSGAETSNIDLDYSTFINAGNATLGAGQNINVRQCRFEDTSLYIYGPQNLAFVDNTFVRGLDSDGARFTTMDRGLIANCNFSYMRAWGGLILSTVKETVIKSCEFYKSDCGLTFDGSENVGVEDCAFSLCNTSVSVMRTENMTLKDVSILDSSVDGMNIQYETKNITAEGVLIANCNIAVNAQPGGQITLQDSTITDCALNARVFYNANVSLVHCSVDMNLSLFDLTYYGSDWPPQVHIKDFLHASVSDTKGAVTNAKVEGRNRTGAVENIGYTDASGSTTIILSNSTMTDRGMGEQMIYHGPFDIIASISDKTATSPSHPSMSGPAWVNISYGYDTPPGPAVDLRTLTEGDDIVIDWECYTKDYRSFLVFRNTTAGFAQIHNSTGDLDQNATRFTDAHKASSWWSYRYYVRLFDMAGNLGTYDNIVRNGDWVVLGNQTVGARTIRVNGTLNVLGGHLILKGTQVAYNFTNPDAQAEIRVAKDGWLEIIDTDNDPATDNGAYIYGASAGMRYSIHVESGGKLTVSNSKFKDIGKGDSASSWAWGYNPDLDYGGFFIQGKDCSIKSVVLRGVQVPLTARGATNLTIEGVELSKGFEKDVLIRDSNMVTFKNCRFNGSVGRKTGGSYMELWNCRNVTIQGNTFVSQDMSAFFINDSRDVRVCDNAWEGFFKSGGYGDLFQCDRVLGLDVERNSFANTTSGSSKVALSDVVYLRFANNKMKNLRGSLELYNGGDFVVDNYDPARCMARLENNTFDTITDSGLEFTSARNLQMINNTLRSMTFDNPAILFWICDNVLMERNLIHNSWMGVGVVGSDVRSINTTYESLTYDLGVMGASTFHSLGGNLNESKTWFLDAGPKIIFQVWVNVTVLDPLGALAPGASLWISDAYGKQMYGGQLANAKRPWTVIDLRQRYIDYNITQTPTHFFVQKGDHTGSLSVTPSPMEAVNVSLHNDLPTLSQIYIDPQNPITTDDLTLVYQYSDKDKDPEGPTTIRWFKNGQYQPAFDDLTTIPGNMTKKKEVWHAQVTPHDTYGYAAAVNTSFVVIKNTLPVVSNLTPAKAAFCSDEPLCFNYTFFDLDGDAESGSMYKWYLYNGTGYEQANVPSERSPPADMIRKGQRWRLEVIPSDGEYGQGLLSDPVDIINTPPTAEMLAITPQLPMCTMDMTISFTYSDHDNDPQNGTLLNWYTNTGSGYKYSGLSTNVVSGRFLTKGEHWKCLIVPYDGADFGPPVWSKEVVVWNAPPKAFDLRFDPQSPTSGDNITCVYGYSDPDADMENGTIVEWLLLNTTTLEFEKTGIISKTIQSDEIARGQQWICRVKPSDGANPNGIKSYGDSALSAAVTVKNSKPQAKGLEMTPTSPNATSALSLSFTTFDKDPGDAVSVTDIRWYRDSEEVKALANSEQVAAGTCKKGEVWQACVVLSDGKESSDPLFTPEVEVLNFKPIASLLRIEDSDGAALRTGSELVARFDTLDADGDISSDPSVRWFRNDVLQTTFSDQLTVPAYATSKDDYWYVEVSCFDGSEYGPVARSEPVRIQNTGPAITGFSPDAAAWNINEGDNQTFSVVTSDPDQDLLLLKWYLNDKAVADHNSFVFSPGFQGWGRYFLNVSCQDVGSGAQAVHHTWTINVANVNRPPVTDILEPLDSKVSMDEGATQRFRVSVQDPDIDDNLDIVWYLDGTAVVSNIDTYIIDADYSSSGRHNVTVVASDGRTNTSRSWDLTIKDVDPDANKLLTLTFDKWGIILEAALIVFTILTAMVGVIQYRKKRSHLKAYMKRIKEISEMYRTDAGKCEKVLVELRTEVVAKYLKGIIEDNHYLILEKKLEDSIRKTREYQIAEDLDVDMSLELKGELDDILKDGAVSNKEFASLRLKILNDPTLTSEEKRDMLKLVNSWRINDKGEHKVGPVVPGKD